VIHRLFCKSLLGFEKIDLAFEPGLVVFSGPSGAGKSVCMGSILAAFGLESVLSRVCEVELDRPVGLKSEQYDLESELLIKTLRKERIRYYINDQHISKKSLQRLFSPTVHYLSVRDRGGFESETILQMLDAGLAANETSYETLQQTYRTRYREFSQKQKELAAIEEREQKLTELVEFATFEIEKIKEIDPKPGEDEALLALKKQLSKIDKINDALSQTEALFAMESSASDLFALLGKEGAYFFDAMNQLRSDCEEAHLLTEELEETDVEALLDRLEKITELKHRYGSLEEAIAYCASKEQELAGYERIEQDKSMLESFLALEFAELTTLSGRISQARISQAEKLAEVMGSYLVRLKLPRVRFQFERVSLGERGADKVDMEMAQSSTATLSGGEHNRLRLALMVTSLELGGGKDGVIVLDEIDANVSGDESIAIADMIARLSGRYQIFAISHQPHLAAKAQQHILIDKDDGKSSATVLDTEGRIRELARIVGGEMPNEEAVAFAKRLLD